MRDDDVVERGEEADHEEEGGGDGHGAGIGADGGVVVTFDRFGGAYGKCHGACRPIWVADAVAAWGPS